MNMRYQPDMKLSLNTTMLLSMDSGEWKLFIDKLSPVSRTDIIADLDVLTANATRLRGLLAGVK